MGKTEGTNKKHKHKHKHKKHKEKKSKKSKKERRPSPSPSPSKEEKLLKKSKKERSNEKLEDNFAIPVQLMNSKSHAPETPEEYKQRQSQIRRVTDEVTGRTRLIKGEGEILEEIVTKDRHAKINKTATKADGNYFQQSTTGTPK